LYLKGVTMAEAKTKPVAQKAAPAAKPAAAKKASVAAAPKTTAAKPAAPKKAAAPKKVAAKPAAPKKAAAPKAAKKVTAAPGAEERYRMVEVAAYYIAERNGFAGDPTVFWTEAEAQITKLLSK
jgi:hypothetical protein